MLTTKRMHESSTNRNNPKNVKRVLFIDDDPYLGGFFSDVLNNEGYQVEVFHGANLALMHPSLSTFDLIITDNIMPHMTGLKFVEYLRILKMDVPVIIWSGQLKDKDLFRAGKLGVVDAIKKPNLPEILKQARNILQREG